MNEAKLENKDKLVPEKYPVNKRIILIRVEFDTLNGRTKILLLVNSNIIMISNEVELL